MKGLLVRVGVDQTNDGGQWNAPVDASTGVFAYVPIPEAGKPRRGFARQYSALAGALRGCQQQLPPALATRNMHLDPDFEHLTYGDRGSKGRQISTKLASGDLLVFYAGMRERQQKKGLVYALIGLFVVDEIVPAATVPKTRWHQNAHTRRILPSDADDVIVRARRGVSGRLERCIPIGNYRERAYRVLPQLLEEWGGLSVNDGYLQRSARLPQFTDARRFYRWFRNQKATLFARNN